MSARDVLILGNFRGASRSALTTATNSLRLNVVEFTAVDDAIAALEAQPWQAMLVDTTLSGASRFCAEARAVRNLFDVPLIALSPRLTDLAFLNALRWGADDVVALGAAEPLAVRLASLLNATVTADKTRIRGTAVVADPDRRRGDGLGRALHLAGYHVKYANDPVSARYYLAKSDASLYVLNAELADPTTLLSDAHNHDRRCVVLAKPTQLAELEQQLHGFRGVVVMSSGGPPENVLFAVNLLFPNEASKRGETRALFGTVVFFRAVGDYRDECGFSYTASPQGIYVRTLAPAPSDKVWVELIPPDGERRVRLVGRVVWSRPYGSGGGEAAPPGFGVRIVDGLGEDLSLWSACLRSLEFRAPATLVPEARFSTPMSRLSSPDDLRPFVMGPGTSPSAPQVPAPSPAPEATATPASTQNDAASVASAVDPVVALSRDAVAPPEEVKDTSTNVTVPPTSLPRSRLRAPGNNGSPRPSLRLSVPGPASGRRDPLLRSGKLSRPPDDTAPPEPPLVGGRAGQGQTVLGLGLLKRDGSVSDNQTRSAVLPPKPSEQPNATPPPEVARGSLDPYIVSPVTGRTLNYGSDTPALGNDRPTFPPHSWDDDTMRTSLIDDISDRPTLTDRLSAPQSSAQAGGNELGHTKDDPSVASDTTPSRVSSAPSTPELFESLPPDALESEAPAADPEYASRTPLFRRDPVARTYFGDPPPVTVGAETDKQWMGLNDSAEDLFSAAERELESATRASIPTSGTLPGFATPAVPHTPALPSLSVAHAGEIAEDTDAEAPLTPPDTEPSTDNPTNDQSPFERDPSTPLPPTRELPTNSPTQTFTPALPKPRRAVWFVVVATLCATLAVALLMRQAKTRMRPDVVAQQANTPPADESAIGRDHGEPANAPAQSINPVAQSPALTTAPSTVSSETLPSAVVSAASSIEVASASAPSPEDVDGNATPTPSSSTAAAAGSGTNTSLATAPVVLKVTSSPPTSPLQLPSKSAWLFVRSDEDARVFVHGVDSGATNTWLETPCGTRFIRLGHSAGNWLGQGFASVIRCRNNNIVEGVAK